MLTDNYSFMYKIEAKVFTKTSTKGKSYLSSVNTQNIKTITINANNFVVRRMKDETRGVPINDFVGLKHKRQS